MSKRAHLEFRTPFDCFTERRLVGQGGSGKVYEVENSVHDVFALKLLDPDGATTLKMRRFKNEIAFCMRSTHKNILKVLDYGVLTVDSHETSFYVMPFYPACLRSLMARSIPSDNILPLFSQIIDGVEAAHILGVIHRDIKPENILYDPVSNIALIADFGIAHFAEELLITEVETAHGERLANFQYAAPEQHVRGREITFAADMYALGLILNEMFTGEIPLGTDYRTIESVDPQYAYLDPLVSTMIKQSPSDRYSSIAQLKMELIGRKNEFIALQELDAARREVVPTITVEDPILADPIRLVGADWRNGALHLKLNRPVNQIWRWALQNMGNHSAVWGKGPEVFTFRDDEATIPADEPDVQRIVDHFKTWLPNVQRVYERRIRSDREEADLMMRAKLQAEVAERDKRARILKNIQI